MNVCYFFIDVFLTQGSSFIKTYSFVPLRYNTALRLTFALSLQYLLFCSTFILPYEYKLKVEQINECFSDAAKVNIKAKAKILASFVLTEKECTASYR